MALPIPNVASVAVLAGNAQTIPRGTDVALCTPTGATVYTLPELDVEPAVGSYRQGQTLQLRNLTAFTITLTPAAGDTIGGNATLDVTAQQYIILVYTSGNNWSILMRVTSAANPEPDPAAIVATGNTAMTAMSGKTAPAESTSQTALAAMRAGLPVTAVRTLAPGRRLR